MQFMILIHIDEDRYLKLSPEEYAAHEAAYKKFGEDLTAAGMKGPGNRLQWSPTAKNLQRINKKLFQTDGPFAETKEQLAGFCVIEVPDLATALEWAAKCPAVDDGRVEVRPLWEGPGTCGH
jgi:hypothetical protein